MYILYHTFTNNANVIFLWYMFGWIKAREEDDKIFCDCNFGRIFVLSSSSKLRTIVEF